MKKTILSFLAGITLWGVNSSHATEYPWLSFTFLNGTEIKVSSKSLDIVYSKGELQLSSPNVTQTFNTKDLKSIRFISLETGLPEVNVSSGEHYMFFSTEGYLKGNFYNLGEAMEKLPSGIYIVKEGKNCYKVIF